MVAVAPLAVLTVMLTVNVMCFDDSLGGAGQTALIAAAVVSGVVGMVFGMSWEMARVRIVETVSSALEPVMILFLIGALTGAWTVSGIIPVMVYYGVEFMSPSFLLVASVVVCSVVSMATGSSWTTVATVGIAIVGVGNAFGMSRGLVAGAVISGAYFGDKMSPLSDTTNLAPAVAGTGLFTHIRYMVYTTGPAWVATLLIFTVIGFFIPAEGRAEGAWSIRVAVESGFNVNPCLLLVPVVLVVIIVRRVPAVPAMVVGTLLGLAAALLFQRGLLDRMVSEGGYGGFYQVLVQAVSGEIRIATGQAEVDGLLVSGGMTGMLDTIFLILAALVFGGMMEASGCLGCITDAMVRGVRGRVSLVGFTLLSGVVFNVTACDQYLAIVVPGRMLERLYRDMGYAPEVLSRGLEDSATVTSVLVPWNSCGATQSRVLGVPVVDYLPFCFFNLLSPVFNMIETVMDYRIRRLVVK